MKVLAFGTPAERILTFATPPEAVQGREASPREEGLLRALAERAREAEAAEHELDRAKATYALSPTRGNLEELRRVSLRTLEAEAAFDHAWQAASASWFGQPPAPA